MEAAYASSSTRLIVFVDDGRTGLEYWWTTDEKPDTLPPPHQIGTPEPGPST
jgi:hypothetical protein